MRNRETYRQFRRNLARTIRRSMPKRERYLHTVGSILRRVAGSWYGQEPPKKRWRLAWPWQKSEVETIR